MLEKRYSGAHEPTIRASSRLVKGYSRMARVRPTLGPLAYAPVVKQRGGRTWLYPDPCWIGLPVCGNKSNKDVMLAPDAKISRDKASAGDKMSREGGRCGRTVAILIASPDETLELQGEYGIVVSVFAGLEGGSARPPAPKDPEDEAPLESAPRSASETDPVSRISALPEAMPKTDGDSRTNISCHSLTEMWVGLGRSDCISARSASCAGVRWYADARSNCGSTALSDLGMLGCYEIVPQVPTLSARGPLAASPFITSRKNVRP